MPAESGPVKPARGSGGGLSPRDLLSPLLLALGYFATADIAQALTIDPCPFAAFWLPSGVYLAALLLVETRRWPVYVAAAVVGNLAFDLGEGKGLWVTLALAAVNSGEALIGAALVRRLVARRPTLRSVSEAAKLTVVPGLVSVPLGALAGAAVLHAFLAAPYWQTLLMWWSGDLVGVLVMAPVLLAAPTSRPVLREVLDDALAVVLAVCVSAVVFSELGGWPLSHKYLVMTLVVWAAFRVGPWGTALTSLAIAVTAAWGSRVGAGNLIWHGATDPFPRIMALQLFVVAIAVTGLVTAALLAERQRARESLQRSEARFRLLFDGGVDAAFLHLADPAGPGRFIEVNARACSQLGYTREELLRLSVPTIDVPEQAARLPAIMANLFEKGHALFETEHLTKDGRRIPVEVNTHFLEFEGTPAVLSSARDISERKRTHEQLQELVRRLEEESAAKSELLKEVNHRVKNNLMSLRGLLLAERQHVPAHGAEGVATVLDSLASRLQGLSEVHEMLSDSQWSPIHVDQLVRRVIGAAVTAAPGGLQTSVTVEPTTVEISPRLASNLALAVNELATNSLKHAVAGRRCVQIRVTTAVEEDGIRLEYRDDGPGYPPEVMRRERLGTGLGVLTEICRGAFRVPLELCNDGGAVAVVRIRTEATTRT